jgi:hypothetical protein
MVTGIVCSGNALRANPTQHNQGPMDGIVLDEGVRDAVVTSNRVNGCAKAVWCKPGTEGILVQGNVLAKGTHQSGVPVIDQGIGNVITGNLPLTRPAPSRP